MLSISQPSFCELIAPLTPAAIKVLWRDRALKLQRRARENRPAALFDWNELWRLIENGAIPLSDCRVTYGRRVVPQVFYTDDGKFNPQKLARLLEQGTSMIVVRLDRHVSAFSTTFHDAQRHGIRIDEVGVIVSTGNIGALETHYDFRDIMILQVEGRKRWRIYGPRVEKPVKSTKKPPQTPPILDTFLEAGDLLFMPAGFWHVCDNGPVRSLHLGLFLKPPAADLPVAQEEI